MSDRVEVELDMKLSQLAGEVMEATPRPSAALIERILADAADVAAAQHPALAPAPRRRFALPALGRLMPDWTSGAVAAMLIALVVGIGLGYGYGDQAMAVSSLAKQSQVQDYDMAFLALDGPF